MKLEKRSFLVMLVAIFAAGTGAVVAADEQNAEFEKRVKAFFRKNDKNGDGKLSREEYPQRQRSVFGKIDADDDGLATVAEDLAFRQKRRESQRKRSAQPKRPAPDHADVKYGPHGRNVLDLWLAKSEKPAPLVIYYHGGGFSGGDKRSLNTQLLDKLRAGGVSVAAANYRLTGTAPFPAQMHDCARALQFLRHHARKYNINPKRIGATASRSVAAQIAMTTGPTLYGGTD